jgi:hypothetical protein
MIQLIEDKRVRDVDHVLDTTKLIFGDDADNEDLINNHTLP